MAIAKPKTPARKQKDKALNLLIIGCLIAAGLLMIKWNYVGSSWWV